MKLNTYVLNLARHADRMAQIAAQLDAKAVKFERVEGYDASQIEPEELDKLVDRHGPIPRMPDGARACTAGHFKILKKFLATDATHALILEDDAVLSARLATDLPRILRAREIGVLNICRAIPSSETKRVFVNRLGAFLNGYDLRALRGIHYTTCGLVVDRSSAQLVLELYPKPNLPIDHIYFNPNISKLFGKTPINQLFPALVKPRNDLASTIQTQKVVGSRKLSSRLKRLRSEVYIAPRLAAGMAIGRYQAKVLEFKDDIV